MSLASLDPDHDFVLDSRGTEYCDACGRLHPDRYIWLAAELRATSRLHAVPRSALPPDFRPHLAELLVPLCRKYTMELFDFDRDGPKLQRCVYCVRRFGAGVSLVAYWLDEGWHSWPEIVAAGTAAAGLYARCGSYIADHRTDGQIPSGVVDMYGTREWAQRLVDVGLWTVEGNGYIDQRYLELNKSAADIAAARKAAAERQRVSRARRRPDVNQRLHGDHAHVTRDSHEPSRVTHNAPIPPPKGGIGAAPGARPAQCPRHQGQPADRCGLCRSEQLGGC